ncbi:MAG: hypothetical protein GF408_06160 [Candidatus Omnitrophica bacterium]|nr:hypothetical protein [Candidatus Omnitrophota bacterium]
MLTNIIGLIWIVAGLLWTIWPGKLKERLGRKITKRMRRVVFGFIIVFGFSLIVSIFKTPGIAGKLIGLTGMVLAIKGIMLFTSRASGKMLEWWSERPVIVFRVQGIVVLAIGIALVVF